MKISEITADTLKNYARVDYDDDDPLFEAVLAAAKQYILSQTGLSAEECEEKEDLALACMVLANDMYENRLYETVSARVVSVNKVVDSIVSQYCKSLV